MPVNSELQAMVDQLYRTYAGQLIAACSSYFGMINLQTAEDVVQDTFIAALASWEKDGVPNDCKSWLFKVCKNKVLNHVGKKKTRSQFRNDSISSSAIDDFFLEDEIEDQQLRWLFASADPSFSPRMRMIFILKAIYGVKLSDIATLLMVSESGAQKMYERAKQKLRSDLLKLMPPSVKSSQQRLPSVINALYLIYTLGYDQPWRINTGNDLCYDALRLTKCLMDKPEYHHANLHAHYSLLLFQSARLPARLSSDNVLVDLEEQDRSAWDMKMIDLGIIHLNKSRNPKNVSRYHLEATIASMHCMANSWQSTPWDKILVLYKKLDLAYPSPFVKLNLAIALLHAEGYQRALEYLSTNDFPLFSRNYQYHATLSRVHQANGTLSDAREHLKLAIAHAKHPPIVNYLQLRLEELGSSS